MANLATPSATAAVLAKYNFQFRKKFGQNFLIDTNMVEKIVSCAGLSKEDCVLEIGPGIGTMTQYLAEKAGKVVAVEIDGTLVPILKDTLSAYDNVTIINADILKVDLNQLIEEHNAGKPIKVVANLPYYITTPIVLALLEKKAAIRSITIMVQKEVADRMQVGPGTKDYGALSLAVQYYSRPEIMAVVPPECFIPHPKVSSSVIRLELYETPPVRVNHPDHMFRLIRASFNQRRKTLVNGLTNDAGLQLDRQTVTQALINMGKSETVRGETFTLEEFAELSNLLKP